MISLISSLSLKLYLNSLVHHRNIFGSSSKVFGNLRKSSDIFGNFRKSSDNVRERSSRLRNNLRKSSESGRKSSENNQKRHHQYVYVIKRTSWHVSSKIWILCPRGINKISLVRCAHLWDIRDLQIGLRVRDWVRVRFSNFKPVTFPEPLFFMLVLDRESSSWDEMGMCRDNVKPEN